MSSRKLSTETHQNQMRLTHKPSVAQLHQEVSEWRRRTQNIVPARNSHKQGAERLSPYAPGVLTRPTEGRRTESIYSPKAASRGDSNIKINLNFEGRAYELESDVAQLQRQLRLKDRDHQLLMHEYEQSKNVLERKLEVQGRKESMQNEHISQLELVVRELKARLVTKNSRQSPVMRFADNELPQHFNTQIGKKLEGSALTCDRSTTRIAGNGLKRSTFEDCEAACKEQPSSQPTSASIQQQQRYSQVRLMRDSSELKLRSVVSTPVSDKNIQIKLMTEQESEMVTLNERLQRQVKDLTTTIVALTRSNDELKERLRISQINNLKITQFKEEIDKFAERLLEKEMESTQLANQLAQANTQSETMRELIYEQQQKLVRMDELVVMVDTLTRQNNNLKKETSEIEIHYEQLMEEVGDLRIVQDEASKLKSNNLELVVQSANEIEAIGKLTMLCRAIQKSIQKVVVGANSERDQIEPEPSPIKSTAEEIPASLQDSLRMQESFVTDGLRSHEAHLQVVSELENSLKGILSSMDTLQQQHNMTTQAQAKKSAEVEELRMETEQMAKQLEQQRSLTNSLLLETKEMRRTIELLRANISVIEDTDQQQNCRKRKQKCKTAIISPNEHEGQLSSIEERPEEERQAEHQTHSSVRSLDTLKARNEANAQQDQNKDTVIEPTSMKSIQSLNRTSLLFDRSNFNDIALNSAQKEISRPNLKAMSFKELSYTLLSQFCDKNDQRTLFTNLMEETVCRYFELESSTIGKSVLEFLNNMYNFPNHTFLAEKAAILLQELKDFSISAKREVASLEEAIECYVQSVSPVFANDTEQFYEDDETEQVDTSHNRSLRRSNTVRSDVNISIHQRSTLKQQMEYKNSDLSSVTDLLEKGLTDTITRLRRRSTISRQSISSSNSSKAG